MDENLPEDVKKMVEAMMGAKSETMFNALNEKSDIAGIMEKMMSGKIEELANPETVFQMAIAQIDACIMQLQSAKELLQLYKNRPTA